MTPGIVLLILGGIFTFAIKAESSWLDTDTLGVVLMLGGIAFIVRAQFVRREVVTRRIDDTVPASDLTPGQGAPGLLPGEPGTQVVERRVE